MKIATNRFGTLEISEDEIILFKEGLLGFEDYHKYIVLNAEDGSPFRWLQSVEDGNLAFVIIEPLSFMFEYDIEIPDDDQEALSLERAEDVVIYAIVSIPENPQDMTANLQGPIIINKKTRVGRQSISLNPEWHVRHKILDELASVRQETC